MKNYLLIFLFLCFGLCVCAQKAEINGCYVTVYHSHDKKSSSSFEVYGDVYVETNPKTPVDLEVRVVSSPQKATYKVFKTSSIPTRCGEWRFVSDRSKAKFTIRYVEDWEDCCIYFTKNSDEAGF